jgi:gluconokinase
VHKGLYVVMGVAGAGKTVIGEALARALAVDFVDGDDFHPPENKARMAAGIPLTDEDRMGWLRALAARIRTAADAGTGVVVTSSALKRSYRDILRSGAAPRPLQFILLRGSRELLAERLASRRGHFFAPSLLESQLATLEEPTPDEGAWVCDIAQSPEAIVRDLVTLASA